MKRGGKAGISKWTGVLLGASAIALTSFGVAESPYDAIVERNVFNLHAPPPPVNPADLIKKTPPPKITLTGITTILGQKKTFLTYPATKPNLPVNSVMLAEGQAQDDIEVKSIDEKAGVVQVINHGEPETLDFEHDGAKASGAPGGPPPAPISLPPPAPPPAGVVPMQSPGNMIRPLRSLPARNAGAENNNGMGFGGGVGSSGNVSQNESPLTPEEQVAIIELQRAKAMKENDPIQNIFPNTELTPEITGRGTPSGL